MNNDENLKNKISDFAALIREGKRAKLEEEKKEVIKKRKEITEKFNLSGISLDPMEFLKELAKSKEVTTEKVEKIDVVDEPLIVEEVKEVEQIVEVAPVEIVAVQPEKDIVSKTAETITKVNENTSIFSVPPVDKTAPNMKAVQDKLKFLEQWVGKISAAGPGSGSYWLSDLGDTDKTSLRGATDGQVITYSAVNNKWVAADPISGGGGGTLDQWARNQANASSVVAQSAFDYANTIVSDTQIDPYARTKANAAFAYANTINAATLSGNTLNSNINSSNLTSVGTLTGLTIHSPTGGNFAIISAESRPGSDTQTWKFWTNTNLGGPNSWLEFPDGSHQTTAFTGEAVDQTARDEALSANTLAQSAFDYANTIVSDTQIDPYARLTANAAFDKANVANTLAQSGYNYSNTIITTVNGYISSNVSNVNSSITANAASANSVINTNISANVATLRGEITSNVNTLNSSITANAASANSVINTNISANVATLRGEITSNVNTLNASIAANSASANSVINTNISANVATLRGEISGNVNAINSSITANAASANSVINTNISANVATLRGEISSNISTANTFTQAAYNTANTAYSTAMNVYSTVGIVAVDTQNAYDQANAAYSKANTAITTSGGTTTGTITSNNAVAFIAGSAANSGVALQMPHEGALRNPTNGFNNMYFDVSNGGSAHGAFQFRSSNGFTNVLTMSPTSVSFNTGATVTSRTPNIGKLPWNSAIDSELTVDDYRFRISNQGGIFPQIIGNGSSRNLAWTGVGAISGSAVTQVGSTGTIVASNAWTTLYNAHGMDSPGDTITVTLQDKAAGRIYRITFMRSDDGSTTGYNIIVERLL